MTRRVGMALTAGVGTLAIAATVAFGQSRAPIKPASSPKPSVQKTRAEKLEPVNLIGWKQWRQVTEKPVKMDFYVLYLCDVYTELSRTQAWEISVHKDRWARVFVNPTGKTAMLTQKEPEFPVGSVIVKAKQTGPKEGDKIELLTVMRKREKGWWPEGQDWEYAVTSGDGRKILETGKLERCASCHRVKNKSGTFRWNYLPDRIRERLDHQR